MAVTTDAEFMMKIKAKDDASKALGGITSMAEGMVKQLGEAALAVTALNQGLELAKKAWGAVIGPVGSALDAYAEAEKMEVRLGNALKIGGQYSAARVEGFKEYAAQLQRTTTLEDDSVLGMLATAKAMGLSDDLAKKLVKSSADLAAAMGIGVEEAFSQMQGTMAGMTKGVAKAVPQIKELSTEQLKMGAGIEMVAARLAGSSEAMLKTWGGMTKQLKNLTGDIVEEIGGMLADMLTPPGDSQEAIIEILTSVKAAVSDLRKSMLELRDTTVAAFDGMRVAFASLDIKTMIGLFALLAFSIMGAVALLAPGAITAAAVAMGGLAKAAALAALNYAKMGAAAAVTAVKTTLVALGVMGTVLAIDMLVRNIKHLKELFVVLFTYVLGGLVIIGQTIAEALGMDKLAAYLENKVQSLAEMAAESADAIDTGLAGEAWKTATGFMDKFKDGMAASTAEAEKLAKATEKAGNAGVNQFGVLAALNETNKKALEEMVKKTEDLAKKSKERGLSEIQLAQLEYKRTQQQASELAKAIKAQGAMTDAIRKQIDAYVEAQKADTGARIIEAQKAALEEATKMARQYADEFEKMGLSQEATLDAQMAQELRNIDLLRQKLKVQGALTKQVEAQLALAGGAVRGKTAAKKEDISFSDRSLGYAASQIRATFSPAFNAAWDASVARMKAGMASLFTKDTWVQAWEGMKQGASALFSKDAWKGWGADLQAGASGMFSKDTWAKAWEGMKGGAKSLFTVDSLKALGNTLAAVGDFIMIGMAKAAPYIGEAIEGAAEVIKGIFSGEFVDTAAQFIDAIGNLPDTLMKAFGKLDVSIGKFIDQFPQLVESLAAKLPALITKIVDAIPRLAQVFVAALPKFVDAILAAIPKLGDSFVKVAPLLAEAIGKMLPKIVRALLDAIPALVRVLPKIIEPLLKAIPEIITAIMDKLPDIVSAIFDAIPQIFLAIFRMVPTLIENLLENIDKFVYAFVEGFIGAIGEIVAGFVDEFLMRGGLERIIGAILRAIPRIVVALVKGIVNGLARALKAFGFKGIKLPAEITELPARIADGAKQLGDRIAKDASQLFKVAELTQAARGQDAADRIRDAIDSSVGNAAAELRSVWDALHEMLKKAWQWVIDNVWAPLAGVVSRAWQGIKDFFNSFGALLAAAWAPIGAMLASIGGTVAAAWAGVIAFFNGLGALVSTAWAGVISFFTTVGATIWASFSAAIDWNKLSSMGWKIWSGLYDAIVANGEWLKNFGWKIWAGLSEAFTKNRDWIKGFGSAMCDGFTTALYNAWDWLVGFFGSLIPGGGGGDGKKWYELAKGGFVPGMAEGGWVKAMAMAGALYMANGGTVYAQTGLMVPHGTDTQPIMATPGEFIVNRASAQANAGVLTAINNGRGATYQGQGQGPVTISVVINAKTNLTPDQIRTEVVPALEKALKRKSLEGGFVIAASGVRS